MGIRETLGLGPKKDENRAPLKDDTFDNTDGPSSPVDLHSAGPTTQPGAVEEPVLAPVEKTDEQVMAEAAEKLEALELSPGVWSLIDRSMDSLARNRGEGLDDPDAVARAKEQAALVKAADNDLQVCIAALVGSCAPLDIPGVVYSFLYRVLGNAAFFANLDYQQATSAGFDLYSDEATVNELVARYVSSTYVEEALARVVDDKVLNADDARESEEDDKRTREQGFDTRRDIELRYLAETYNEGEDIDRAILTALSDLRLFFQLTTESMGWPADRPMPFGNVRNPNGTFSPIEDAQAAVDAQEIKRQAGQQRRREKRAATMSSAAERAAAIVQATLAKGKVHTRK
jgi:hypothetical protein